jgi:hypothetical protein
MATRRALWIATIVVAAVGLVVELGHHTAIDAPDELVMPLSLSFEENVPTWYASALLLSAGLALAAIARGATRQRGRWTFLAAAFFYLSLDEVAQLHEHLNGLVRLGGVLYFSWIVPAAVVVAILGVVYVPFLRALPPRVRSRFLAAGCLYVGGALVMELPLGWWATRFGEDDLGYAMIDFVEEAMELVGVTLFLDTLLEHRGTLSS